MPDNGWIPVAERLPENAEDVLFCDEYGYICIGDYWGGRWKTDNGGGLSNRVVAWMPLPEPYEEEDNDRN